MTKHPHKEIRKVLAQAEAVGMAVVEVRGHTFGYIVCTCGQRMAVYSTARNPERGAKVLTRFVIRRQEHVL